MRPPRLRPGLTQIAILLLAAAINLFHIDRPALWNDEGFSFFAAQSGLSHAISFIAEDTQPPLYYLTLSLWLGLGTSVFVIRALSAAAMTLAIVPVHAAARRLFGEKTALLASFLFAIAPLGLTWAQKARPYPLQLLLVACAFWGFVRVWHAGNQTIGAGLRQSFRQRRLSPASSDLGWFAYAVGGAFAMLAQSPAGFFLLGCNIAMALRILPAIGRNRILLMNWIGAQIVLILIWMLWLPMFVHQVASHLTAAQIASRHPLFLVSFTQVLGTLQGLFGVAALWRPAPVFLALCLGIAIAAILHIIRHRRQAWPLLVVILAPIAVCLAAFFLLHPVFGYVIYTFVWMLVPYSILLAAGILAIRPAPLRWAALAFLLLGDTWGLKNVYQNGTPPLDRVAAVIRTNQAPGDGIVFSDTASGRFAIAYYLGAPYGAMPGLGITEQGTDRLITSLSETNELRRVWVVLIDGETPAIDLDALRRTRHATLSQRVGDFQIIRYE